MAVIHYQDDRQAVRNADMAHAAGCRGVFLIHMDGNDAAIDVACQAIKSRHPAMLVGANRLATSPDVAVRRNITLGIDATWADAAGATSAGVGPLAGKIRDALDDAGANHLFFGSVAFKYQAHEPYPAEAAKVAVGQGWIATTSGPGTGQAPDVEKLRAMKDAIGDAELAVASGVTPENVRLFAPYLDWILVATGVSSSFHEFDPGRLEHLMLAIGGNSPQKATIR